MEFVLGLPLLWLLITATSAFNVNIHHDVRKLSSTIKTAEVGIGGGTTLFSSPDPNAQPVSVESPVKIASSRPRKKKLKTFARYLEIESWKRGPEARDLEAVLSSIGGACKQISRIVQRAQTDDLYGAAVGDDGSPLDDNVQGEVPQKLDLVCNAIMLKQFCGSSNVIAAVASEEEDSYRTCCDVMGNSAFAAGDYVAVFDPLDGSKNIDASLPVGTIFGIYKCPPGTSPTENTFLQTGNEMVAAGYCLYS